MAFGAWFNFPLVQLWLFCSVFFSQDVFSKVGIDRLIIIDIAPMGLLRVSRAPPLCGQIWSFFTSSGEDWALAQSVSPFPEGHCGSIRGQCLL